jgi:hypothetical protein
MKRNAPGYQIKQYRFYFDIGGIHVDEWKRVWALSTVVLM